MEKPSLLLPSSIASPNSGKSRPNEGNAVQRDETPAPVEPVDDGEATAALATVVPRRENFVLAPPRGTHPRFGSRVFPTHSNAKAQFDSPITATAWVTEQRSRMRKERTDKMDHKPRGWVRMVGWFIRAFGGRVALHRHDEEFSPTHPWAERQAEASQWQDGGGDLPQLKLLRLPRFDGHGSDQREGSTHDNGQASWRAAPAV
jgi:hypothetical protein